LAAARTGFELGIPFNELNRVLDLGFKPLPWGDRGYLGANLRELGAMSNSSGACAGKGEIDPGKESDGRVSPAVRAVELLRAAEEREAQEPEPPLDPLAARKLRRFFFEQRGRVLAALQSADLAALQVGKLLDVQAEQEQLRAWLAPVLGGEGSAEAMPDLERAQALLATHFAALEGQIIEALAASETREQISARVRALYNQQT
jgi:hypothetical protein